MMTFSENRFPVSKKQIVLFAIILIAAGTVFWGGRLGWFESLFRERVTIPSGAPYAEATVIGAYDGVVLAERIAATDAKGNILPKKMEILTDEKTVFAKLTSSGPVKIAYAELSEGDVIWAYSRIRSLEETLAEPADPELAIPFEEMVKNPRERIIAVYIVAISGKNK